MRNIALKLRYIGAVYSGWQRQPNSVTVQETLEDAIREILREEVSVTGCSRTDSGVHALEYVCNFKSGTKIPPEKLPLALNSSLPDDISVMEAWAAPDDFHARFSSTGKRYLYRVRNSRIRDPFLSGLCWQIPYKLDTSKMEEAAAPFIGRHDFSGFMSSGGAQKTTTRTISDISVTVPCENRETIDIEVEADAFLYNMVRIIAGTIIYAGWGKIDPHRIPAIIDAGDRKLAGVTAPARGLFLKQVFYDGQPRRSENDSSGNLRVTLY